MNSPSLKQENKTTTMGRKKIIQAWIADDVVRRTTFKKRCNGLFKKVSEITTLCDVQACAVVYGPHDAEPAVCPNFHEATMMLQSFQELPEITQCKKMMSQETFLEEKLNKAIQQYQRLENKIQEIESSIFMYEFMSGRDLNELNLQGARKVYYIAGSRQKVGYERMESIMAVQGNSSVGVNYPPLTNEEYYLDDAVASYAKELMMQNHNQIPASNFNHQNQFSLSNVNQQFMIQHSVNKFVENKNQAMFQQACIASSANHQLTASNVNLQHMIQLSVNGYEEKQNKNVQIGNQGMASNADQVFKPMASMEEDGLWMDPELFGSLLDR